MSDFRSSIRLVLGLRLVILRENFCSCFVKYLDLQVSSQTDRQTKLTQIQHINGWGLHQDQSQIHQLHTEHSGLQTQNYLASDFEFWYLDTLNQNLELCAGRGLDCWILPLHSLIDRQKFSTPRRANPKHLSDPKMLSYGITPDKLKFDNMNKITYF